MVASRPVLVERAIPALTDHCKNNGGVIGTKGMAGSGQIHNGMAGLPINVTAPRLTKAGKRQSKAQAKQGRGRPVL